MPLNIEKSGEQDKELSKKWLVNTDPCQPAVHAGLPVVFFFNLAIFHSDELKVYIRSEIL